MSRSGRKGYSRIASPLLLWEDSSTGEEEDEEELPWCRPVSPLHPLSPYDVPLPSSPPPSPRLQAQQQHKPSPAIISRHSLSPANAAYVAEHTPPLFSPFKNPRVAPFPPRSHSDSSSSTLGTLAQAFPLPPDDHRSISRFFLPPLASGYSRSPALERSNKARRTLQATRRGVVEAREWEWEKGGATSRKLRKLKKLQKGGGGSLLGRVRRTLSSLGSKKRVEIGAPVMDHVQRAEVDQILRRYAAFRVREEEEGEDPRSSAPSTVPTNTPTTLRISKRSQVTPKSTPHLLRKRSQNYTPRRPHIPLPQPSSASAKKLVHRPRPIPRKKSFSGPLTSRRSTPTRHLVRCALGASGLRSVVFGEDEAWTDTEGGDQESREAHNVWDSDDGDWRELGPESPTTGHFEPLRRAKELSSPTTPSRWHSPSPRRLALGDSQHANAPSLGSADYAKEHNDVEVWHGHHDQCIPDAVQDEQQDTCTAHLFDAGTPALAHRRSFPELSGRSFLSPFATLGLLSPSSGPHSPSSAQGVDPSFRSDSERTRTSSYTSSTGYHPDDDALSYSDEEHSRQSSPIVRRVTYHSSSSAPSTSPPSRRLRLRPEEYPHPSSPAPTCPLPPTPTLAAGPGDDPSTPRLVPGLVSPLPSPLDLRFARTPRTLIRGPRPLLTPLAIPLIMRKSSVVAYNDQHPPPLPLPPRSPELRPVARHHDPPPSTPARLRRASSSLSLLSTSTFTTTASSSPSPKAAPSVAQTDVVVVEGSFEQRMRRQRSLPGWVGLGLGLSLTRKG